MLRYLDFEPDGTPATSNELLGGFGGGGVVSKLVIHLRSIQNFVINASYYNLRPTIQYSIVMIFDLYKGVW